MNTPLTDATFGKLDTMVLDDMSPVENVVWYHANCLDGTCAAWVASQYLNSELTHFQPMQYGDKMEEHMQYAEGKVLYILDWMPEKMEDLESLLTFCERVVVIDHHDSAIKKFQAWADSQGLNDGDFDVLEVFLARQNEWSGAMGTAIWFQRNQPLSGRESAIEYSEHWLVKAIDDRDRWQFKLPGTKEINAGLFHMGFDLEYWTLKEWDYKTKSSLIETGITLMEAKQKEIDLIIASGLQFIDDANDNAYAAIINAPYHLASEMGSQIVADHKFRIAIIWQIDKSYKTYFSLRSLKENPRALNCAEIAGKLGGGGHVNAAGAKMDMPYQMARDKLEEVLASYE